MKDVRLEDSGVYSCQATNGFGHRTVDFTIHVFGLCINREMTFLRIYNSDEDNTANSPKESLILANTTMPPTWLSDSGIGDSNAVQVNNGGRLELRCPAMGRPLPDIRWYKNGILLGTSREIIYVLSDEFHNTFYSFASILRHFHHRSCHQV